MSAVTPAPQPIIALVVRQNTAGVEEPVGRIVDFLRGAGYRVVFEEDTAAHLGLTGIESMSVAAIGEQAKAAVVVGGDGTMLGIARQLAKYDTPLIGINQGRLGFITDIPIQNMLPALGEILEGRSRLEKRTLLEARVMRDGEQIYCSVAVNDVVVARGTGAGMVELKLIVDGEFMYNQRSDGLIVSTPTGSTAYSLSAGGPLLHPSLQGIVLVPIAPHALSNRPIVVPDTSEIVVELVSGRDISVNFDMQTFTSLQLGDRIVISRSPNTVTFLHPHDWSYYHTLREKLHWNEYPTNDGKLK
ncbi:MULTISPECIES: NAD kinase [unclassified Massilia]|uniref:NAD kinase n=1 Tax=unclassified Massilia TaxID=2609279 RepID=UPI001B827139|nr:MULTISPECIES: NAD kinase [unclassified Massilia]MBQ5939397.1 NAD kinase [Massilia sp. AB1]MBQ5961478.1 NAD kinase [Massilia sp. ZL223]